MDTPSRHLRRQVRPGNPGSGTGSRPLPAIGLTKRTSFTLPPDVPMDEWSKIGRQINTIAASSAWWLGDWLIYGQAHYPDLYKQAVEQTSLDYQTLRNYAWVARQYPITRRRASLSFQHHAEVASLAAEEQDQWLDRAERFSWSRNELRNRVRASRQVRRDELAKPDRILKIQMSVPPDQKQRWMRAAASESEQDFMEWMVAVLDHAAAATLRTAAVGLQSAR